MGQKKSAGLDRRWWDFLTWAAALQSGHDNGYQPTLADLWAWGQQLHLR